MAKIDEHIKVMMLKGETGANIKSIDKTATNGLVDTYTVTLTDGSKSHFNVTNGKDGTGNGLHILIASKPATASADTSTLTATVYRDGDRLTEQDVAKIGTVAWYVDGTRKATGYEYTCAAGTSVGCRLEAPRLSDGTPVTIAAATHTPYATHGYVDARKADASVIMPKASIESSATASQAYAAGDYVAVSGILRKVTSAIAKGDAISDSNSTATTVTGELATIGNSVSKAAYFLIYDDANSGGKIAFYARGCMATLTVAGVSGVPVGTPMKVQEIIPEEFRPDSGFYGPLVHRQSNNVGQIWVPAKVDGDPHVYLYAGVASSGLTNSLYGTVSWIYATPDDLEEK